LIHPGVQFNSVEGDALFADRYFGEVRAYLGIEAVAVHAEIRRGVSQAKEAW